jgi:RNA polymerase sigma-32 factor
LTEDIFPEERKEFVEPIEDKGLPVPYDPLKKYLSEVSKHPVLTREEELEISTKVFKDKDRAAAQKLAISNLTTPT